MRLLIFSLLATSAVVPQLQSQASCADTARSIVAEFQSRQKNVGISVAVMLNGRMVFQEASGLINRDRGIKPTADTRFGIASITKAFTGVALLKLVEQGKIDLDAEIQRYVPEFPRHSDGPVTIRELAAHLGGIRHWGSERNAELYARHFDDVMDILPLFSAHAFVGAPGKRYSYSSYGYNLLAMAIQRASGVPFQKYLQDNVLNPLGLPTVAFDRPGMDGDARPVRYSWYDLKDYHDLTDSTQTVPDWDYSHNMAGGGLVSSVGDLLRFARAMRRPGFLSESSLALLWHPTTINGVESPMSFGWFPAEDRLGIGGSNAGLQSGVAVWRDRDLAVAALANSWGAGSRSGEFMSAAPDGLLGRLAAACGQP
jgi:CubicO group peptidase (beta-lactamase class C family)